MFRSVFVRRSFLLVASAALGLFAGAAMANDTTAELKTGGLIYNLSNDISMDKEELFISTDKVTVKYVFHNSADHDVTSLIAFPMPDIDGGPESNIAINDFNADNFLGFSVRQDGKPIKTELQQRAFAMKIDQTDILQKMNIPLMPMSEAVVEAVTKLPKADQNELVERGLAFIDVFDGGNGPETQVTPLWSLKSAYTWKTTFPAGKDVTVEHEYTPSVGGTVTVTFLGNEDYEKDRRAELTKKYCMDDDFIRTVNKVAAPRADGSPRYVENWLSYVLSTGANWSGPIKDFTLTIDKGDPANLISFCGEGVKKIGKTTFQMKKTDFVPEADLDILLLVPTNG